MNRKCEICGLDDKKVLYQQNFHNDTISLMSKYDVVSCNECGFVFADNIPSQKDFDKYYSEISRYEFQHNEGIVSNSYIQYTQRIIDFLEPYIKNKDISILDMGCSTGTLLALLKIRGYTNLFGVDPSPSCVQTVNEKYNIKAEVGTVSSFMSDKKFDVIVLSAIVEHIVDLSFSIKKIISMLNPNGLLFIEVPDAERFDEYIFTPFQQFSIEHINYLTSTSIENLLTDSSMEILRIEKNENTGNQTIDPNLFVLSKFSNKKDKIMKDRDGVYRIKNYINMCNKFDIEQRRILNEEIKDKEKIIIWGVGTNTQRLLDEDFNLSKVAYFVDSNINYVGKTLQEKEIRLPIGIKEDYPILILTFSYQNEVIDLIRNDLNLDNEILTIYE